MKLTIFFITFLFLNFLYGFVDLDIKGSIKNEDLYVHIIGGKRIKIFIFKYTNVLIKLTDFKVWLEFKNKKNEVKKYQATFNYLPETYLKTTNLEPLKISVRLLVKFIKDSSFLPKYFSEQPVYHSKFLNADYINCYKYNIKEKDSKILLEKYYQMKKSLQNHLIYPSIKKVITITAFFKKSLFLGKSGHIIINLRYSMNDISKEINKRLDVKTFWAQIGS